MGRHSIRLQGYDYSQDGYYFVTMCTHEREHVFGEIVDGEMILNSIGNILKNNIIKLSIRFDINIDIYQIMPNHVHLIIIVVGAHHDAPDIRAIRESPLQKQLLSPQKRSLLSQIIGYMKANTSKNTGILIWQRNYYERIIRSEPEYLHIREYIKNNVMNWSEDVENQRGF